MRLSEASLRAEIAELRGALLGGLSPRAVPQSRASRTSVVFVSVAVYARQDLAFDGPQEF